MKSVDLTIKWKVNHILECIHVHILKNNLNIGLNLIKLSLPSNKPTVNHLSNLIQDDEVHNDWIYDSDAFPLMFDKYLKYEEVTVMNDLIINSQIKSYSALPNHIKRAKKCTDYLIIMKDNFVLKCIKTSNINSMIDVANVLTYHFNNICVGDFNKLKYTDNIYVLVCKKE